MVVDKIKEHKIISIIRGISRQDAPAIFEALYEEGIKLVEVTLNTEGALAMITEMRNQYEGKMFIGAGTVLSAGAVEQAVDAGAQFILTPTMNKETIEAANKRGIACVSGALTPTEILTAYEYGADLIKVFPAGIMGPQYIKDIHGPLPHIPLVPTGGIDYKNAGVFLGAGAAALGIGSTLVKGKESYNEEEIAALRKSARQFKEIAATQNMVN